MEGIVMLPIIADSIYLVKKSIIRRSLIGKIIMHTIGKRISEASFSFITESWRLVFAVIFVASFKDAMLKQTSKCPYLRDELTNITSK